MKPAARTRQRLAWLTLPVGITLAAAPAAASQGAIVAVGPSA